MPEAFKICPGCRFVWPARADFLGDPDLVLIGFQVDLTDPHGGLFLFNHRCGSTLALPVGPFLDLVGRPPVAPSLRGTPQCAGHCLHRSDIDPCRTVCECAFVREVLQVVRHWPKRRNG